MKKNDRESLVGNDIPAADDDIEESSIKDSFISKPLNGLMKERLVPLLRYRSAGMSWNGAEELYTYQASHGSSATDAIPDKYFHPEPANDALPDICNADHFQARNTRDFSYPLLAMQFLLRHFEIGRAHV